MNDFCKKTNSCVYYTVAKQLIAIGIIWYLVLMFVINEHFVDVHLDYISFDQPFKCSINVFDAKAAYKIIATAIWNESDGQSLLVLPHEHTVDNFVDSTVTTDSYESRVLVEIYLFLCQVPCMHISLSGVKDALYVVFCQFLLD